jgi:protein TonB
LRSNIEGTVYLELFVDPQGVIRQISILKETPEGRGFGEAAVNAFKGIQGKPAESNGQIVAVRFRYPIRFTIR